MADPISIIGAIDGSIKVIERTLSFLSDVKNAKPEMAEFKTRLDITVGAAERSKKYLLNRRKTLDSDERDFWRVYAEILKHVVEDSNFYIKRYGQGGFIGSAWYAAMGKAKFTKLLQNHESWTLAIDNILMVSTATNIDQLTDTVNQTGVDVSSLKAAVQRGTSDFASMGTTVDQIYSGVTEIQDSLSDIKKRVEIGFRASNIEELQLIRDNDPILKKIFVDFKDFSAYPKVRDAKPREWVSLRLKESGGNIPVLIEKVAVEKSRQADHREALYKVALELEQLRECGNILRFVGYAMDDKHFLLISDGSFKKTLHDLISVEPLAGDEDQPESSVVSKPSSLIRIKILVGVVGACKYLHSAGIFHKDIHSSNVFINEITMEPKLTGFTGSRKFDSASIRPLDQQKKHRSTLIWQAPERVGYGVGEYSYKCDIYSIGVLMLEVGLWVNLDDGQFESSKLEDILTKKDEMTLLLKKDLPADYNRLVQKCIHREARDRPKINEVSRYLDCLEGLQMLN